MKYLIIYDLDGNILMQQGSSNPIKPRGVPSIIVNEEDIKGTRIIGVDVQKQKHTLILEDIPKDLRTSLEETVEQYHMNNQKSIAELTNLVGILLAKGVK